MRLFEVLLLFSCFFGLGAVVLPRLLSIQILRCPVATYNNFVTEEVTQASNPAPYAVSYRTEFDETLRFLPNETGTIQMFITGQGNFSWLAARTTPIVENPFPVTVKITELCSTGSRTIPTTRLFITVAAGASMPKVTRGRSRSVRESRYSRRTSKDKDLNHLGSLSYVGLKYFVNETFIAFLSTDLFKVTSTDSKKTLNPLHYHNFHEWNPTADAKRASSRRFLSARSPLRCPPPQRKSAPRPLMSLKKDKKVVMDTHVLQKVQGP